MLLLRLRPDHDPDAPYIVDWGQPNDERVQLIADQGGTFPVYVRRRANGWEYVGQFRVAHVATDATTRAEREAKAGHIVSYAIYLERSRLV